MTERKLTNKDMIRVRRRAQVRGLAIAEEHEVTHSGTGVHRRLHGEEDHPQLPTPTPTAGERTQMILHVLLLAGTENISISVACSRTATRYGLAHNQVSALKDEVLHYLEQTAQQLQLEDDSAAPETTQARRSMQKR